MIWHCRRSFFNFAVTLSCVIILMHLAFSLGLFSICFAHSNFQANLWWAFSFIRVSNCAQASPRSRLRQCYTVFACLMEAYGRTINYDGAWGIKDNPVCALWFLQINPWLHCLRFSCHRQTQLVTDVVLLVLLSAFPPGLVHVGAAWAAPSRPLQGWL